LSAAEVRHSMAAVPAWTRKKDRIEREFAFPDFPSAVRFVVRIARAAEEACHHPDIDIRWNRVRLSLTTHDEGGLSERDFVLAARCDALAARGRVRA